MTLVQLQYVVQVAKYRNFTLAAENAFVSQPTLSMQIQKLERDLNVELFDRTQTPIKVTAIGQKIVNQSKIVLAEFAKLSQIVEEDKSSMNGKITVGIIPTIISTLVPLFYGLFKKRYPNSNLIIKELKTKQLVETIKDGSIDFGIANTPLNEDSITEKKLFAEPMVLYFRNLDKSLQPNQTVDISQLDLKNLLMLEEGHCFRDRVLDLCNRQTIDNSKICLESGNFATLVGLVNEGYGFTILPLLEAERAAQADPSNIFYFNSSPKRDISLICSKNQIRTTFVKNFSKLIKEILVAKKISDITPSNQPNLQIY